MIRYAVVLSFLICFESIHAQVYKVEVDNLENILINEKEKIKSLINSESVSVYVFSKHTDSLLFQIINNYRESQSPPLQRLNFSVRLDTLAKVVGEMIGESGKLAHYSAFPELRHINDLLNIENIAYNASNEGFNRTSFTDDRISTDIVSLQSIMNGWVKSTSHNRNMLSSMQVGSAKVLLRITKRKCSFFIETIALFEADYLNSKREVNDKFQLKNAELRKLPIIINRKVNRRE